MPTPRSSVASSPIARPAASNHNLNILILGGNGYVGSSLSHHLSSISSTPYDIACVDLTPPPSSSNSKIQYFQANIANLSQLEPIFSSFQPNIVIHLASYGMSGSAMLDPRCYEINVIGVKNSLDLCQKYNCNGFIYTSTYNVIFGGQEIVNGDESLPYYPLTAHPDQYGPSKTQAEQLILSYNDKVTSNGSKLYTCSLRPAAIYGPDEMRHFPRIVSIMDSGLFVILIGSAIVDWVHIDNLVQAYMKIIVLLQTPTIPPKCGGKSYFISDGTPINQNEFLRPLCDARGVTFPKVYVPVTIMMFVAYFLETIHHFGKFSGIYSYEPFMTRSEVNKVAVTHYFSIENAKKDLNYHPTISTIEGSKQMGLKYRQTISNHNFFRFTHPLLALLIIFGMALTALFAFDSPDTIYSNPLLSSLKSFTYLLFRNQQVIRWVFYAAVGTHILEGLYAVKYSADMGCSSSKQFMWFVQSVLYGYGSLGLLVDRKKWLLKENSKKGN